MARLAFPLMNTKLIVNRFSGSLDGRFTGEFLISEKSEVKSKIKNEFYCLMLILEVLNGKTGILL